MDFDWESNVEEASAANVYATDSLNLYKAVLAVAYHRRNPEAGAEASPQRG
jgi:hypothetical protein